MAVSSLSHVHTRIQYVSLCTTDTEHCINVPSSLLPLQRMRVAQGRISVCKAELRAQKPLRRSTCNSLLPSNIRHISEPDVKHDYKNCELIGKWTCTKHYLIQELWRCVLNSYQQTLNTNPYFTLRLGLSELCHNFPWLHAFCDTSNVTAIMMTFHPYNQEHNRSLNIFDALYCAQQYRDVSVTICDWKQVLLVSTSALVYLQAKGILHNDIKTDNTNWKIIWQWCAISTYWFQ